MKKHKLAYILDFDITNELMKLEMQAIKIIEEVEELDGKFYFVENAQKQKFKIAEVYYTQIEALSKLQDFLNVAIQSLKKKEMKEIDDFFGGLND